MGSTFAAPVEPPPDEEDPDLVVLREVVPLLEAGVATGFTSTVLLAAALLLPRVVRRRGVGEGVAMIWKKVETERKRRKVGKLPIRPDSRNR